VKDRKPWQPKPLGNPEMLVHGGSFRAGRAHQLRTERPIFAGASLALALAAGIMGVVVAMLWVLT
jgi:hypothetical protein